MIENDKQLEVTLNRIRRMQEQVAHLRRTETNPSNFAASVGGYMTEIDRMQLEVREYLMLHPADVATAG